MPLVNDSHDSYSPSLASALTARFTCSDGMLYDSVYNQQAQWLVALSAFERWFDLLEDELQITLGRRLAHAAADSEEARTAGYQRPKLIFGKQRYALELVNSDWALRGLGQLEVPPKAHRESILDVEVVGRLPSSLSAGMANASWEWIVQHRHRFRWEDRGASRAIVHLERTQDKIVPPPETRAFWPTSVTLPSALDLHPLSMPTQLPSGCWEIQQERHVLLSLDLIIRFLDMAAMYSEDSVSCIETCDWSFFKLSENTSKVWSASAKAMCMTYIESGDLFLVAEPEHWVEATREPLSEHGLGFVTTADKLDENGGIRLGFKTLFHPTLVTGLLMGCWARANGRDAAAIWSSSENEQLSLDIFSKDIIA